MNARRGAALVMVLAATALLGSLAAMALHLALIRARLAADARWRTEAQLVAASALAGVRVGRRADLDSLGDGGVVFLAGSTRPDGWSWQAELSRSGALLRIVALARHAASDGSIWSARRASLMLARDPADTVRVLGTRARF